MIFLKKHGINVKNKQIAKADIKKAIEVIAALKIKIVNADKLRGEYYEYAQMGDVAKKLSNSYVWDSQETTDPIEAITFGYNNAGKKITCIDFDELNYVFTTCELNEIKKVFKDLIKEGKGDEE